MRTAVDLRVKMERLSMPTPECGCWLWLGYLSRQGYGRVQVGHKSLQAHRVSWDIYRGPVPQGQHVLHRCDTPSCINPDHLFLGTHADNMRDMASKGRMRPRGHKTLPNVTHCWRGHEFTEANTYRTNNGRTCRTCNREAVAAYKRRKAS